METVEAIVRAGDQDDAPVNEIQSVAADTRVARSLDVAGSFFSLAPNTIVQIVRPHISWREFIGQTCFLPARSCLRLDTRGRFAGVDRRRGEHPLPSVRSAAAGW